MKSEIFATAILLAGAGCTFQLGNVQSPSGATVAERDAAIMYCKDEARTTASAADKQVAYFLLSATIVGYPAYLSLERDTQRTAFSKCMSERGYTVTPPTQS